MGWPFANQYSVAAKSKTHIIVSTRFISVQHEQNAVHMADGFSRATGKTGVCIAQNGPGITNFVTGVAAAFWAHRSGIVLEMIFE